LRAWILLCLAVALHLTDEALTGFLGIYNPTVIALRQRWAWFPIPTFEFGESLADLVIGITILLALSVVVYHGVRGIRIPMGIFGFRLYGRLWTACRERQPQRTQHNHRDRVYGGLIMSCALPDVGDQNWRWNSARSPSQQNPAVNSAIYFAPKKSAINEGLHSDLRQDAILLVL
jgi:hypothetical protein